VKRIAAAFALKQKGYREYLYRRMEGSMRFSPFTTTAVCSLLIALGVGFARPAWAAEIRVLNANALTMALRELAAEHTKQTGNEVPSSPVHPDRSSRRWTPVKNSIF
jgi:hypothetical protein